MLLLYTYVGQILTLTINMKTRKLGMSEENLAKNRDEKAKKVQHPKGKLSAYERINLLLDEGSFTEIDENVVSDENPDGEAVITGSGTIHGRPVYLSLIHI